MRVLWVSTHDAVRNLRGIYRRVPLLFSSDAKEAEYFYSSHKPEIVVLDHDHAQLARWILKTNPGQDIRFVVTEPLDPQAEAFIRDAQIPVLSLKFATDPHALLEFIMRKHAASTQQSLF